MSHCPAPAPNPPTPFEDPEDQDYDPADLNSQSKELVNSLLMKQDSSDSR